MDDARHLLQILRIAGVTSSQAESVLTDIAQYMTASKITLVTEPEPKMTLGQHQEAFAEDICKLMLKAFELGYSMRLGEFQRTLEQQQIYVKTKRSLTLDSMHLKKCAADIYFTSGGDLVYPKELGTFWESLNPRNRAGMFWKKIKDGPHYQRTV